MNKFDIVSQILQNKFSPAIDKATCFAPSNIALCKYWGKRNQELNLPVTSSLSISLGEKGAKTSISKSDSKHDVVFLNEHLVTHETSFYRRLVSFLNLFRPAKDFFFHVETISNIPIAAGLASSACGFASVVLSLNKFFAWQLDDASLSILARLGSGSASRSIWQGFVEWDAGVRDDGMDSYGKTLDMQWPDLRVGLLLLNQQEKSISSREAMQCTVKTSELYKAWPQKVTHDLTEIKTAIATRDFELLGKSSESNALAMHATMLSAWPPISYCLPETLLAMRKIWQARAEGFSVYFTQDAGPNLKLLFLDKHAETIKILFPEMEIITLGF